MLCKQCGSSLGAQANFCPRCGHKISDDERQEKLAQKHPAQWLKILFGLILAGLIASLFLILFSDTMTDVVSEQLHAIKDKRMTEAYYDYTSKNFQKATSLKVFRDFIDSYPFFSKNESVRFIDRNTDDGKGFLHAMILTNEGYEVPVEYELSKDGDKWLVETIRVEDIHESPPKKLDKDEAFDSTPLKGAIQGMMDQIRLGHMQKAYDDYTSQDFRSTTSFQEFDQFIKNNPSFSYFQSVELNNLSFDNNTATMSGILKASDGKSYGVEYDLTEEKGAWKVFHVKVLNSPVEPEKNIGMKFTKFVMGTGLDSGNIVTAPVTVFKKGIEDIYLNLYMTNVKANTTIQVVFQHVDTNSSIAPVSKVVSEEGDVILAFIFSPPPSGWPVGNYRLFATSSTGESANYDFKVEE